MHEGLYESRSTLGQNATTIAACLNISSGDFHAAVSATAALNTLVGAACVVSIVLIFILKVHRIFQFRLVLYLIVITLCYMLDDTLQLAAFEVVDDGLLHKGCFMVQCYGLFQSTLGLVSTPDGVFNHTTPVCIEKEPA